MVFKGTLWSLAGDVHDGASTSPGFHSFGHNLFLNSKYSQNAIFMRKYLFRFFFLFLFFPPLTCATCRAAFTFTPKDLQLQIKHKKEATPKVWDCGMDIYMKVWKWKCLYTSKLSCVISRKDSSLAQPALFTSRSTGPTSFSARSVASQSAKSTHTGLMEEHCRFGDEEKVKVSKISKNIATIHKEVSWWLDRQTEW